MENKDKDSPEDFLDENIEKENLARNVGETENKVQKIEKENKDIKKEIQTKEEKSKFNSTMKIASVASFLSGLFFFSSNITGFAVFDLTQQDSNWIGIVLFILGIIGIYFFWKK